MARINLNKFKKIDKERNTVHTEVLATYTSFTLNDKKYVQLDTYGNDSRENPEKISQSFQFDEDAAKCLVNLLIKEFDLKY